MHLKKFCYVTCEAFGVRILGAAQSQSRRSAINLSRHIQSIALYSCWRQQACNKQLEQHQKCSLKSKGCEVVLLTAVYEKCSINVNSCSIVDLNIEGIRSCCSCGRKEVRKQSASPVLKRGRILQARHSCNKRYLQLGSTEIRIITGLARYWRAFEACSQSYIHAP